VIIKLGAGVVAFVVDWAQQMAEFKQANGGQDKWFDVANTSMNVQIVGKLGEVVAGVALGCPPSFDIYSGGDDGCDLAAWGLSWQVKTSSRSELIFDDASKFSADAAVLVMHCATKLLVVDDPRFEVLGGISRSRFMSRCVVKDYGYGDRLVVGSESLTPLDAIGGMILP